MKPEYFDDLRESFDDDGFLKVSFLERFGLCSILFPDRPSLQEFNQIADCFSEGVFERSCLMISFSNLAEEPRREVITGKQDAWKALSEGYFLNQILVNLEYFIWGPFDSDYYVLATQADKRENIFELAQFAISELDVILNNADLSQGERDFLRSGREKYMRI